MHPSHPPPPPPTFFPLPFRAVFPVLSATKTFSFGLPIPLCKDKRRNAYSYFQSLPRKRRSLWCCTGETGPLASGPCKGTVWRDIWGILFTLGWVEKDYDNVLLIVLSIKRSGLDFQLRCVDLFSYLFLWTKDDLKFVSYDMYVTYREGTGIVCYWTHRQ
jgi:hypothetical protein